MTRLTLAATVLAVSIPGWGQHLNTMNPVRPMPAPANALRYGNILWPGGISHSQRVSGTVSGSIPYTGVPYGHGGYPRGGRPGGGPYNPGRGGSTVVVPYAVPVYGGSYYAGYPDYGYAQQPSNVTVVVPQQPTPSVVINQYGMESGTTTTSSSEMRDYSDLELPQTSVRVWGGSESKSAARPDEEASKPTVAEPTGSKPGPKPAAATADDSERPTIYLIAMTDDSVRQAIGYWIQGKTLHYVTPKGSINRVSMEMVDRNTTVQLNSERNLDFDFNAAVR